MVTKLLVNKKRGIFDKRKKQALFTGYLYPKLRQFSIQEAQPILKEIKKREKSDRIRICLTNYLIVRSVSVFENFLLNQAHRLARGNKKSRKLFSSIQTNAPIADQVISTYSFMNLDAVNYVFSTLLGINDFIEEIKKESIQYAPDYSLEDAHIKYTNPLHKKWTAFLKIFDLRHDIIHHNKHINMDYSDIRNYVGTIIQFLMCSIMVTNQN